MQIIANPTSRDPIIKRVDSAPSRSMSENLPTPNPKVISDVAVRTQASIVRSYATRVRSTASFVASSTCSFAETSAALTKSMGPLYSGREGRFWVRPPRFPPNGYADSKSATLPWPPSAQMLTIARSPAGRAASSFTA